MMILYQFFQTIIRSGGEKIKINLLDANCYDMDQFHKTISLFLCFLSLCFCSNGHLWSHLQFVRVIWSIISTKMFLHIDLCDGTSRVIHIFLHSFEENQTTENEKRTKTVHIRPLWMDTNVDDETVFKTRAHAKTI